MTRTLTAALTAALATLAALTVATPAATANTYEVYSCWAGYGTYHNPNASTLAWTRDQAASGGHFTAREDCGVNPTDGSMMVRSAGSTAARNGEFAQLKFNAPVGLTVDQVQFWRKAWAYGAGSGTGSQRNAVRVLAAGTSIAGGTDADGTVDVAAGTRGTGDTTSHGIIAANSLLLGLSALGQSSVEYRVGCDWLAGCPTTWATAPGSVAAGVDVYGARVAVRDTQNPAIVVSDGGVFSDVVASGIRPVIVSSASDESGIKRLAVFADFGSIPIGELDYEHDVNWCDWTAPAPCQSLTNAEIPVDTRQIADGDHSFVVKAFDAAGNERASSLHYVTIKNQSTSEPTPDPTADPGAGPAPAPAPGTDPANQSTDGLPNGTTGTGANAGAPVVDGSKLAVTFDQNGRAKVRAKYGRIVVVRGTLTDGAGQRIANAQIDYSARSTVPRARVQNLGAVRTDSNGTFLLTVATKVGSRKLSFAYRPQLGGAVAASADAQLEVIPPISLRITPRHVRNKHSVTFHGRLSAGPIPRKGKLVNLQVIVEGHWHTFATVRTSKSGRFKFRYRFMRTYGYVTYRFRALSRYEAAYPFVAGNSHTVRVSVTSCPVGCD